MSVQLVVFLFHVAGTKKMGVPRPQMRIALPGDVQLAQMSRGRPLHLDTTKVAPNNQHLEHDLWTKQKERKINYLVGTKRKRSQMNKPHQGSRVRRECAALSDCPDCDTAFPLYCSFLLRGALHRPQDTGSFIFLWLYFIVGRTFQRKNASKGIQTHTSKSFFPLHLPVWVLKCYPF